MKKNINQNHKKQDVKKGGLSPAAAAITGAIVGAGIAIAGTVALENKGNRKKVKQMFSDVKDQAVEYMEKMQKKVENKKDNVEKKIAD